MSDKIHKTIIMNLLFIDSTVTHIQQFIDGCNANTKHIVYKNTDTFNDIKEQIIQLNINKFAYIGFVFVNDYSPLKMFVSNNTYISFQNEQIMPNNTTNFIKYLITTYEVKTIDFLACKLLLNPLWKSYFDFIVGENTGIVVRASNNRTGNLNSGGDWILESTNTDVKSLYFNDNISNWTNLLDMGNHIAIITNDTANNLYTCGYNGYGQLGKGTVGNTNSFVQATSGISGKKIVAVSCGEAHTAVITDELSDNLYTCGDNYFGQSGINNIIGNNTSYSFIKVQGGDINGKTIKAVSCGVIHTAVITTESTNNLYTCGYNNYGQLGTGDNNNSVSFVKVQSGSIYGKNIIAVSCGYYYTTVITSEGSDNLYTCGYNNYGQLGTGNNDNSNYFVHVNGITGKNIIAISCGHHHIAAITDESSDNLYTCGFNSSFGQLGIGTYNYCNSFTLANSGIAGKKIIAVSCGIYHTSVITDESNNNLYTCGSNIGQFGIGDTKPPYSNSFVRVNSNNINGKKIVSIVCNFNTYITTIEHNANLYTCGVNWSGELGLGDNTDRSSFTQVQSFPNQTVYLSTYTACIHGSSKVMLSDGTLKQIASITVGDKVITSDFRISRVKELVSCWTNVPGEPSQRCIVFEKNSLDNNIPSELFVIDPGHPMSFITRKDKSNKVVPAKEYVNNKTIYYADYDTVKKMLPAPHRRYDLVLENDDAYFANNIIVKARTSFKNQGYNID